MATRRKTTARKPAATTSTPRRTGAQKPSKKPAATASSSKAVTAKPAAPEATPTPGPTPVVIDRARRGDLLDALDDRSPMRRADLKVVMELVLEEMGNLIDAGDEMVLPPLGKLKVKKRVPQAAGGDMLTIKLKRLPVQSSEERADG